MNSKLPRRRLWHETSAPALYRHGPGGLARAGSASLRRLAGDRRLEPEAEHSDRRPYTARGEQPDHANSAIRADAAEPGAQSAVAAVLGIAADHQRDRRGEQPDAAGARTRLRCRTDRTAVPAALPNLQRQRHAGAIIRGRADALAGERRHVQTHYGGPESNRFG